MKELDRGLENLNPIISVIIPVYNVEKYVCQCVDSILNQTFKNIEIIIVDDASTDESYQIVKSRYSNINNITILLNQRNLGQGMTRNAGMKAARGKYLYFMDSDDVLLPRALEVMWEMAEKCDADVLHMSEWYEPENEDFDFNKNITAKIKRDAGFLPKVYRFPLSTRARICECYGRQRNAVMVWLNIYRLDFLCDKKLEFPSMIHEDNAFLLACYAATDRIYCIPGAFYLYRQRSSSTMGKENSTGFEKEINALLFGMRYVGKTLSCYADEEIVRQAQRFLFRDLWMRISDYYVMSNENRLEAKKAIERIVGESFDADDLFVSLLTYYACSSTWQIRELKRGWISNGK